MKKWQRSPEYIDFLDSIRWANYRLHMLALVKAYRGSDARKSETELDVHDINFADQERKQSHPA